MIRRVGARTLYTPRLELRRFRLGDFQAVYSNWTSDPEVARYCRWHAQTASSDTLRCVAGWLRDYRRDPFYFHWAIVLRGTEEPVGSVSIAVQEFSDARGELGYSLSRRLWGQGIATEAAAAAVDYAFRRAGFNRIEACCAVENIGSARVMQKLGMRYEGVREQYCLLHDGTYADCHSFSLLRENWNAAPQYEEEAQ